MIKLSETREIPPYVWAHPVEGRRAGGELCALTDRASARQMREQRFLMRQQQIVAGINNRIMKSMLGSGQGLTR
jgi:hypothetical protein